MLQASFSISVNLLAVSFTDTSTVEEGNEIKSWAWDFGEVEEGSEVGNEDDSDEQHPEHTYTNPGKYKVTLTVTDQGGNESEIFRYIVVDTKPILPVSIEDFVKLKLPKSFPYQPEQLTANIATWQIFIQPLVNAPGVLEADTFNEIAYPPIINALIAYIVAYQVMLDYVSSAAISATGSGIEDAELIVKRIETGPSNAEFRDTSDYLKFLVGANGLIEQVKKQMCTLASRSRIEIPYCPPLPMPKFIPKKAGRETSIIDLWDIDISQIQLTY